MPNVAFEPGDEICPPWWPRVIWDLHYGHWPKVGPGGPVNYPPAIQDLMASIAIHTFSYLQLDQKAAQTIRTQAEEKIVDTAKQLSKLHDQAVTKRPSQNQ
jgi:hypothetical protein